VVGGGASLFHSRVGGGGCGRFGLASFFVLKKKGGGGAPGGGPPREGGGGKGPGLGGGGPGPRLIKNFGPQKIHFWQNTATWGKSKKNGRRPPGGGAEGGGRPQFAGKKKKKKKNYWQGRTGDKKPGDVGPPPFPC